MCFAHEVCDFELILHHIMDFGLTLLFIIIIIIIPLDMEYFVVFYYDFDLLFKQKNIQWIDFSFCVGLDGNGLKNFSFALIGLGNYRNIYQRLFDYSTLLL